MNVQTIESYIPDSVFGRVAASIAHQQAYRTVLLHGLSLTARDASTGTQFANKAEIAAGLSRYFGEQAPEDMRPDPEEVVTRFLTNQRQVQTSDPETVAEAMGVTVEEAKAAVQAAQNDTRREEQELKDTLEAHRASTLGILNETPPLSEDVEIDQATMASVLDKVANKLDDIAQQAIQRAARTNRKRVQTQLSEQRTTVLEALERVEGKIDELEEQRP